MAAIPTFPVHFHGGGSKRPVYYYNKEGDLVCRYLICKGVSTLSVARYDKNLAQVITDGAAAAAVTGWLPGQQTEGFPSTLEGFDMTTGIYTVPQTGYYEFTFQAGWTLGTPAGSRRHQIVIKDPNALEHILAENDVAHPGLGVSYFQVYSGVTYAVAGTTVKFFVQCVGDGANPSIAAGDQTWVTIKKIS